MAVAQSAIAVAMFKQVSSGTWGNWKASCSYRAATQHYMMEITLYYY